MNGLDKITSRIEQDGRLEIDQLLSAARSEATEIAGTYAAQAEAEARKLLERGRQDAEQRKERLDSVDQLECRKALLAAKQELLDEAFDKALQKLQSLPQDKYVSLLADLAVKASTTGREKLIFSQADRARVGKDVVLAANKKLSKKNAMLTLAEETRPIQGGFILSSGDMEVNCTFASLVRLQRSELAGSVAKILFDS